MRFVARCDELKITSTKYVAESPLSLDRLAEQGNYKNEVIIHFVELLFLTGVFFSAVTILFLWITDLSSI